MTVSYIMQEEDYMRLRDSLGLDSLAQVREYMLSPPRFEGLVSIQWALNHHPLDVDFKFDTEEDITFFLLSLPY
jgi:hypothetical protein